ncbi:MAG TPA: response regulator [Verrucomicrobiae bacterium]|jgi:DNA-binding NtrC family response regulator|nr:response regulator [Verrucomicrobiae bacterium]
MNPAEALNTTPGKREHVILIVDDEIGIREFLSAYLQSKDFNILTAASAEDALHVWAEWENRIDLLVTDIVMPGMNGKALAEKLLEQKPSLHVIFMSGYLPEEIAEETLDGVFFKKPFHPHEFLGKIREVLRKS